MINEKEFEYYKHIIMNAQSDCVQDEELYNFAISVPFDKVVFPRFKMFLDDYEWDEFTTEVPSNVYSVDWYLKDKNIIIDLVKVINDDGLYECQIAKYESRI